MPNAKPAYLLDRTMGITTKSLIQPLTFSPISIGVDRQAGGNVAGNCAKPLTASNSQQAASQPQTHHSNPQQRGLIHHGGEQ